MTNNIESWQATNELRLQEDGAILRRWMSVPIGWHEWRLHVPAQSLPHTVEVTFNG